MRSVGGFSFTEWDSDSGIVSGLTDIGISSIPSVFQIGSDWYLAAGEDVFNFFTGWKWNNSTSNWDSNIDIVNGLAPLQDRNKVTVFEMGAAYYAITGNDNGIFKGFKWNEDTSSWDSDTGIISGLTDVYYRAAPEVFQMGGDWYLISGDYIGEFTGWKWNDSTSNWDSNTGIVSGLTDIGRNSKPSIFQMGSDWYLIAGEYDSFAGWKWNVSTSNWDSDTGIISGLTSLFTYFAPTVFLMDNNWYLILGTSDGNFYGFKAI
jgi:hypothetical protein